MTTAGFISIASAKLTAMACWKNCLGKFPILQHLLKSVMKWNELHLIASCSRMPAAFVLLVATCGLQRTTYYMQHWSAPFCITPKRTLLDEWTRVALSLRAQWWEYCPHQCQSKSGYDRCQDREREPSCIPPARDVQIQQPGGTCSVIKVRWMGAALLKKKDREEAEDGQVSRSMLQHQRNKELPHLPLLLWREGGRASERGHAEGISAVV